MRGSGHTLAVGMSFIKPPSLTHHSHNQNRLDVFGTLWAGEWRKGMGFETLILAGTNFYHRMVTSRFPQSLAALTSLPM